METNNLPIIVNSKAFTYVVATICIITLICFVSYKIKKVDFDKETLKKVLK